VLQSRTRRSEQGKDPVKQHLLLTRYDPARVERGEMLKLDDVLEILAIPLLGVIPESESVLKASNAGNPVIMDAESQAGQAYSDAVARFLGEEKPHRFLEPEKKKGFFGKLFGGRAA
jgi:septum site-determining protein MinD